MGISEKIKEIMKSHKHFVNKPSIIQIGVKDNRVVIIFNEPVTSVAFDKMQLLEFIETLTSKLPTIKK